MNDAPFLRVRNLSKSYGNARALRGLTLDVPAGEVHAVCGENGAGKSTLIKLLSGVAAPDEGEILIRGRRLEPGDVARAEEAGIAVMHQESTAFPHLNAVDNVFVGREPTRLRGLLLDRAEMRRRTLAALERLGERIDVATPVGELPLAQRQMVALARALSRDCKLLIMDEPTASLSKRESTTLLRIVRQLRAEGVSVLYVSHRLEEVFDVADRVTVLRDGSLAATRDVGDLDARQLIRLMAGRDVDEPTRPANDERTRGEEVLQVDGLARRGVFRDVSFAVRRGEIVGLAGLVGAGRSEIARAIFGVDAYDAGIVRVAGRALPGNSVPRAIAAGLALVPEDRQREGLVLPMTVAENVSLAVLPSLARWGFVNSRQEAALVARQLQDLHVKTEGPGAAAETLSGGNQQKLVLGRWLATRPHALLLDEPTRGVDVGAKAQVHRLIRDLARGGLATLLISSELPELLSLCDRLLVVRSGRIVAELNAGAATQESVLALALPDGTEQLPA